MPDNNCKTAEQLNDVDLLRRYIVEDDRASLEALFGRHVDMAYATAMRVCRNAADAEDAVQAAFLKVMQKASLFRGRSESELRVWMTKTVIGTCKDRIRSEVRRRKWEERAGAEMSETYDPDTSSGTDEAQALNTAVFHALNDLPEHYRLPIWLHHYQGLSLRDTAQSLSVSENTLHMQLKRGMQKLKDRLTLQGVGASSASLVGILPMLSSETASEGLYTAVGAMAHDPAILPSSVTAGAGTTGTHVFAKAAAVVLLTGTVVGGIHLATRQPLSPAPPSPAPPALIYRWDFNMPELPKEIHVLKGKVRYLPNEGPDGNGCLETEDVVIQIDIPITDFPIAVSFKTAIVNADLKTRYYMKSHWFPARSTAMFEGISNIKAQPFPKERMANWHSFIDYYFDSWIYRRKDNTFHDIHVVPLEPDGRITLMLTGQVALDNLRIERVAKDEIPETKALDRYLAAFNSIPPEKRKKRVFIPSVKGGTGSGHDGRVSVEFYTNVTATGVGTLVE